MVPSTWPLGKEKPPTCSDTSTRGDEGRGRSTISLSRLAIPRVATARIRKAAASRYRRKKRTAALTRAITWKTGDSPARYSASLTTSRPGIRTDCTARATVASPGGYRPKKARLVNAIATKSAVSQRPQAETSEGVYLNAIILQPSSHRETSPDKLSTDRRLRLPAGGCGGS